MSKQKRLQDFDLHDSNPFEAVGVETRTRYKHGEQREVFDTDDGSVKRLSELDQTLTYKVDTAPFVKVFTSSLSENKFLSIPGTRLYWYVLEQLRPGKDQVLIDIHGFLDSSGYAKPESETKQRSTVHYYRAITELLDKRYLSRRAGAPQTFYVNLNKFFNGDRTKL